MTSDTTSRDAVVAELLRLEAERCRALNQRDWPALEALLPDDYYHAHSTGNVQHDRPAYMRYVDGSPRVTSRGDLSVRVYGDTAVMTGPLYLTLAGREPNPTVEVLQVWARTDGRWRTVAFQAMRPTAGNSSAAAEKPLH